MDVRATRRVLLRGRRRRLARRAGSLQRRRAVRRVAGALGRARYDGQHDAHPDPPPTPTEEPTPTPTEPAAPNPRIAGEVITGLAVPWGIAFLPDGSALVGERDTGRVLRVSEGSADPVGTLDVRSRVDEGGETGLLGLALHPAFETNRLLYVYLSTDDDNRIVRMTYDGSLGEPEPILTGIGTSTHHNGGGLVFGPDGLLYASTGDAENPANAQDTDSVDGKVLRMTDAGRVPDGNPFDNLTWSFGHRNVEGIRFDDTGRLWIAEFGDKGADELNLIRPGRTTAGRTSRAPTARAGTPTRWPSGRSTSAPPAGSRSPPAGPGSARCRASACGRSCWTAPKGGDAAALRRRVRPIRSVALARDGSLWVTTSNRDGRTDPRAGDDRILRVTL